MIVAINSHSSTNPVQLYRKTCFMEYSIKFGVYIKFFYRIRFFYPLEIGELGNKPHCHSISFAIKENPLQKLDKF